MRRFTPTRSSDETGKRLAQLLRTPDSHRFTSHIRRLQRLYRTAVSACPVPLAEAGLIVTPEIRCQSELFLPLGPITEAFYRLYRESLTYPPLYSSTPFHQALSWADLYAALPPWLQLSPDPAALLAALLDDSDLRQRFVCHSFLPRRFYGGSERYAGQNGFIREWLKGRKPGGLRCLDAACGTGEQSYGLARLVCAHGVSVDELHIAGWTIEPLEVWAAACGAFPHDRRYEAIIRQNTSDIFAGEMHRKLEFAVADLLDLPVSAFDSRFDLILCNGLLGGPILHERRELAKAAHTLTGLLSKDGILLVADSFHGGWKQKHPQSELRALFKSFGFRVQEAGEGLAVSSA